MDTISVLIGFLVGVIATAIAVEFGLKKIFRPPAQSKVTGAWRLSDHQAPLVVCHDAAAAVFPKRARVVTAGGAHPDGYDDRAFRRNPNARSNYLVETDRDRATIFMGPIQEGTLALATVDPVIVARLRAEHRRLWETGEPLVEETALADAVRHLGLLVRTRGRVQECIPYRDRHLIRLVDGGTVLGVVVDEPLQLTGKTVSVMGRVMRGTTGYPLIDAEEVRIVGADGSRGSTVPTARTVPSQRSVTPPQEQAPEAASLPAQDATGTGVLRVPDPKAVQARVAAQAAAAAEAAEPQIEFEEAETEPPTEAERRRLRARVVLRR